MREITIFALLYFTLINLMGQNIQIGQDADETFNIIESSTNLHNNVQHSRTLSTSWSCDTVLENGEFKEIFQCYSNEYIYGLGDITYYCKHFIFKDNHLAFTITRFADIDSITINKYLQYYFGKYKIGPYYFSSDYNYYSVIKISNMGFVDVLWRRAEWDDLTPETQDTINNRLSGEREVQLENWDDNDSLKKKEYEIKSKTYDMQVLDSSAYNLFITDLRESLIDGLKNNPKLPGWKKIENTSEKSFTFRNSYNALFRLYDQSKLRSDTRYLFIPDDGVFIDQSYFELVSGSDTACDFIKYYSPILPALKKEGYYVMTDTRVTDIDLLYVKGITKVKIRHGAVKYRKNPPPSEIRKLTSENFKKLDEGLYEIKYEAGTVMDSTYINTEPKVMATVGGTIAATVLVSIACVIYYLSGKEE